MATLASAKTSKQGFFTIYKPGQGKYLRWGTVAGLSIFTLTGAAWVGEKLFASSEIQVKATAAVIWVAICAVVTFLVVNTPKIAEFLIMTESEMRKVTWPTRREVINSTKIVILLTLALAFLLWVVDLGFYKLFEALKIL
jgi:preprotein translocase subunit SecE